MREFKTSTYKGLMQLCEGQYQTLVSRGVDEDVARDRTWDALCACMDVIPHCNDERDRLFEDMLRDAAERYEHAED